MVVAYIDNSPISLSEIDNSIRQEIFDELNRIYILRKTTLEYLVSEQVIEKEAKKQKVDKTTYLETYYQKRMSESVLKKYIAANGLEQRGVIELKRTLKNYPVDSKEGQEIIREEFKLNLKKHLSDSLLKVYNVKITLTPPPPPNFKLNPQFVHYRGNLKSNVTVLEISDFECSSCMEQAPVYAKIYEKYKDKVKFGFTHFAPYVGLPVVASEAAANQGKFWEVHDWLFKQKTNPDTAAILKLGKDLNLNLNLFEADLKDKSIGKKLESHFEVLKTQGLYGTPTVIINGKLLFHSTKEELEKNIEAELNK